MTKIAERLQIEARPAAKIEDRVGWLTLDVLQKRRDVLTDVVRARALPEIVGALIRGAGPSKIGAERSYLTDRRISSAKQLKRSAAIMST